MHPAVTILVIGNAYICWSLASLVMEVVGATHDQATLLKSVTAHLARQA